jgi:hypothetical protein
MIPDPSYTVVQARRLIELGLEARHLFLKSNAAIASGTSTVASSPHLRELSEKRKGTIG